MTKKCYYEILNVTKNSNINDIKKSYKKLALLWHPDKNPDNKIEAEKMFKIINEAYEILSDDEKRKLYDRYGHEGVINGNVNEPRSSRGCYGDDFDGFFDIQNHMFTFRDPNDIFREFFGSDPFENMFGMSSGFIGGQNMFHDIRHGSRMRRNNRQTRVNRTSQPYNVSTSNIRSNHDLVSPFPSSFLGGGLISPFGMGGQSMFSMFPNMGGFDMFGGSNNSGGGGGGQNFTGCGNFRSTSTSTKIVNGKRIRTTKIVENGSETVTEEVDGVVINKTVNGRQVAVN